MSAVSDLPLVFGHRIGRRLVEFPHRCPGFGCAIARWISDNAFRDDVKAVTPPSAADERIVPELHRL